MNELKIISHGNLLFRGDDDKKILELAIAPPLILAISKQIINFCNKLTPEEMYCLSWHIHRGDFFKKDKKEINNE